MMLLPPPGLYELRDVPPAAVRQEWGEPRQDRSVEGKPLSVGGRIFARGLGTHAASLIRFDLAGRGERFRAWVGVDDEVGGRGSVRFLVRGDGRTLFDSGVMRGGEGAKTVDVPLARVRRLELRVEDGGDGIAYDHADWAEAVITMRSGRPAPFVPKVEPPIPIASHQRPQTEIHGPRVVGGTPGRPFLWKVPATGQGPLKYAASGLPPGLLMDSRGVISGAVPPAGEYPVALTVSGPKSTDRREVRIVSGRGLALTPPMGWNSWNVWAGEITQDRVRDAARSLLASGLADYGYAYVNVDDCWQAGRDGEGRILSNAKFPDLKALCDEVHGLGLKIGTYSSPGPRTCAGFTGSWEHEARDARQYADWGFDYLKYDWCSYGEIAPNPDLAALKKPYDVMRDALAAQDRDIVYSLCQYGMGDVYRWGREVGGNLWRTTGDITDTWASMSGIGFDHHERSPYAGPGGWNDPDMLVVGRVGWGNPHPTRLTPNEQITHVTLWSMLAAPLIIGCDLTRLDSFTKDLLMNHEVIEVDQDPLGKAARRVWKSGNLECWSRPLEDGDVAVALFNRGEDGATVRVPASAFGGRAGLRVRNVWLRRDAGRLGPALSARVPPHGAQLFRMSKQP